MFYLSSSDHNGQRTAIVFDNAESVSITESHPNYRLIRSALIRHDVTEDEVKRLLSETSDEAVLPNLSKVVQLSERISLRGESLYFDGDLVDKAITRHIVARYREGNDDWTSLVRFMENLAENPSEKSRRHLYHFLTDRNFQITEDGCFIAYKGVRSDGTSSHSGPGIVNGVEMNGHLPNQPGSVLEIARSYVDDDRSVACSRGLHVGTYAYARSFESRLLTVKVNPRDVVSVPSDCRDQKVRVCRYEVLELAPAIAYQGTSYRPSPTAFDIYGALVEDDEDEGYLDLWRSRDCPSSAGCDDEPENQNGPRGSLIEVSFIIE